MPHEFATTRRVEFAETDMAGILHFTAFFRYMEEAEHAFLRSRGLSVATEIDGQFVSWPRASASCEFAAPVKFEDVVDIHLSIAQWSDKSIRYRFRFEHEGREIANGEVTAVCCTLDDQGRPKAISIPPIVREKLELERTPSAHGRQ